jgi:hypothetical protein
MHIAGIIIYLLICMLVAWCGRNKAFGAAGFFVLSLFITPFVVAIILLVTSEMNRSPIK